MLNNVQLKNFKRHSALEAGLTGQLNTIVGPNYAGKTSLLQAVLVAFFGPSALPGGAKVATRNGAKGFEVNVAFESDGVEYAVRRTKTKAELSRNGKVIANSASQVTAELESLIGMSKKRFLQLKVAKQKETAALLTLGGGELHNVIEEVTGADLISRIIERLKDEATRAGAHLDMVGENQASIETLEQALENAGGRLSFADEQAHAEYEATVTAEVNETHAREQLDEAKAHNHQIEVREARLASLRDQAKRAWDRYSELRDKQIEPPTEQQVAEARDSATAADERVSKAVAARNEFVREKQAMDKAKADGQEAAKARADLYTDGPSDEEVEDLEAALRTRSSELAEARHALQHAESALTNSACPTCERPFENSDPEKLRAERDEAQQHHGQIKGAEEEARIRVEMARKDKARAERDASRDEVLKQNYDSALAEFQRAKQRCQELHPDVVTDDDLEQLKAGLAEQREEAQRLRDKRAVWERQAGQIAEYKADYDEAMAKIKEIPGDSQKQDLKPLQSALDKAAADLAQQREAEAKARQTLTEAQHAVDTAAKDLEQAQEAEKRRAELEGRVSNIRALIKFLRDNRDRFLADVWDGVMAQASEFAATCTGGYIQSVTRQDNGSFAYIENGEERPIEAASGAQASIMGLGVQLALSRMLPSGFNCTLLDEPTADMADDHALTLTTALAALDQQIVMVSHREFDGSAAENTIQLERV